MSIIGSNILAGASGQGGAYEIEQSLRFDGSSAFLSRTPGSAGNRKTWTWSGWVKRSKLGAWQTLFSAGNSSPSQRGGIRFTSSDQLNVEEDSGGYVLYSTQVFRDVSAWYHLVIAFDSTQATSTDRIKVYVNGSQITNFSTTTYPSQNFDSIINTTDPHRIGELSYAGNIYELGGYLAEVNFIDGSALDPTDFGEFDENGVWRPIKYAGSYTGNSFYLKFDAADVDGDSSGLGNDWTASAGISTSGTGTDVMSDTPTTNYATYNPLVKFGSQGSFSEGNLASTASGQNSYASIPFFASTTGKYYVEFTANSSSHIAVDGRPIDTYNSGRYIEYQPGGTIANGGGASGASFTTNDIIGVAIDMDNLTVAFYKNNSLQATVNLSNGGLPGAGFCVGNYSGVSAIHYVNFGQRAFAYTPPTGFLPLNTSNLPAPDIADGSQYFDINTWSGNDSTQSFTNSGFQPDLVWVKNRNNTSGHMLFDSVRGVSATSAPGLSSNQASAEVDYNGTVNNRMLTSLDPSGFSVGADQYGWHVNKSGRTYVGWQWLAANGTSSNTAGSITSTVSANATAGFSIVSYTGTGSTATVGHGLGVAPSMIIFKNRDDGGTYDHWSVYHSAYSPSSVLYLNTTDTLGSATAFFDTAPTSTVFQVKTENKVNGLNDKHIAYCFAEVEGYSKIGSYTGNGPGAGTPYEGPFIYTGFTPKYFLYKTSSNNAQWQVVDSTRGGDAGESNPISYYLVPNDPSGEVQANSSNYGIDFCSNGIKIRTGNVYVNNSGWTYIYAAFAENPFGGSGVSPATAR